MKITYMVVVILAVLTLFNAQQIKSVSIQEKKGSDTLKAQIEVSILSNGSQRYAKLFDKVRTKEKFRIFIKADQNYYLWILSSNDFSTLLLSDTLIKSKTINIFPEIEKYYEFDGKQSQESLLIFLSKDDKPKHNIKKLKNAELIKYVKKLSDLSKCNISETGEPLININGNLRDLSESELRTTKYYGINYLIKEYKFNVKK